MSHLNSSEVYRCMDSLYKNLFGAELYVRWRKLKMRLMFDDEREFISCILNVVENQMLTVKSYEKTEAKIEDGIKASPNPNPVDAGPGPLHAEHDDMLPDVKEEMVFDIDSDFDDYGDEADEGDYKCTDMDAVKEDEGDGVLVIDAAADEDKQPVCLDFPAGESGIENGLDMDDSLSLQLSDSEGRRDGDGAGSGGEPHTYHCSRCTATFPRKASLVRHSATVHIRNEQYRCSLCSERFNSRGDKIKHEQASHADQIKTFQCAVCEKIFTSEKSMTRHQEHVHYKLKNYSCVFCGRRFAESWIMRKHVNRVHHNMRYEFPCPHCTREFATKHELRVHQARVHL